MKFDLKTLTKPPARQDYVLPTFGTDEPRELPPELQDRLRRPMVVGAGVIGVFVVGLGLWASLDQLATGITAMAPPRCADAPTGLNPLEGSARRRKAGVKDAAPRE